MSQKKRLTKDYDPEFRKQAYNLTLNENISVTQVAKDLGVPIGTMHCWVNKFKNGEWKLDESLKRIGNYSNSQHNVNQTGKQARSISSSQKIHDHLSDLERKNRDLEIQLKRALQERDILKKAMAYCLEVPK